jgi:hypothetical protein
MLSLPYSLSASVNILTNLFFSHKSIDHHPPFSLIFSSSVFTLISSDLHVKTKDNKESKMTKKKGGSHVQSFSLCERL